MSNDPHLNNQFIIKSKENRELEAILNNKISTNNYLINEAKKRNAEITKKMSNIVKDNNLQDINERVMDVEKFIGAWVIQNTAFAKMIKKIGKDKGLTDKQILDMHTAGMINYIKSNPDIERAFNDNGIDIYKIVDFSQYKMEFMGGKIFVRQLKDDLCEINGFSNGLFVGNLNLKDNNLPLKEPTLYKPEIIYKLKTEQTRILDFFFKKKEKNGYKDLRGYKV